MSYLMNTISTNGLEVTGGAGSDSACRLGAGGRPIPYPAPAPASCLPAGRPRG